MVDTTDAHPARLLLLEDHDGIRELVRIGLERDGHFTTCTARSAREAGAALTRDCPDVAVLDLSLPDMDGVEVVRQIRAHCATTRIVAFSGSSERRDQAREAGADEFVLKGGPMRDLIDTIKRVTFGGE